MVALPLQALLSEAIADCHVQKFSHSNLAEDEAMDEVDFAHLNYRQAATTVMETKALLRSELDEQRSVCAGGNNVKEGEGDAWSDLWNEATLSLAKILMKQGCVSAKFDNHRLALDLFAESLAAWEEAAVTGKQQDGRTMDHGMMIVNDNPLVIETLGLICSDGKARDSWTDQWHAAGSLKNTIHLESLLTALQMAWSHHAIAVEVMAAAEKESTIPGENCVDPFKIVVRHHLCAFKLICETKCLRVAFNMSSVGEGASKARFVGAAKKVIAANRAILGGGRLTAHGRDLTALENHSEAKDIVDNAERFIERCRVLIVQQQVCISHACYRLQHHSLSSRWLSTALDNLRATACLQTTQSQIQDMGLSDLNAIAKVVFDIVSALKRNVESEQETSCVIDTLSLYEGGLLAFNQKGNENPRLLIHIALEALKRGLKSRAMAMFQKTTNIYSLPAPPEYYDEILHAIDAQIIIQVEEGDVSRAISEMHLRWDVVQRWLGPSLELANVRHRLGCFCSLLGQNEQCIKHLDESLHVGAVYDGYDSLDSIKLLGNNFYAMKNTREAIRMYEFALSMEDDSRSKIRLMNALSHFHLEVGGRSTLVVNYLKKSLNTQQDDAKNESTDLIVTNILLGNAFLSEKSFSQAMNCYNSAISLNPDKGVFEINNLQVWYSKGVALSQSGDTTGATHAFGLIMDEVNKDSAKVPPGVASVLNNIGIIYFQADDFASAIRFFTESLCLKNESLSPSHKAGVLCNIASAYYRMQHYQGAEMHFKEALVVADSTNETSSDLNTTIMCKLAYIYYKRKHYLRAHNLFSNASEIGNKTDDVELRDKCEGYAIMSYLQLKNKNCDPSDETPATTNDSTSEVPKEIKTFTSAQDNQGNYFRESSDDHKPTLPDEEHATGSGGGDKRGLFVVKGLSRLIKTKKSPQRKKKDSDQDKNSLGQDSEPTPSCPSDPNWSYDSALNPFDYNTTVDDDSTENDMFGTGTKDDNCLVEMPSGEIPPAESLLLQRNEAARKPAFEERMFPIIDEQVATRYSSAVYPRNSKMLRALGVKLTHCDSIELSSKDRQNICNRSLEYLLKQTENCRAKYALGIERSLNEELNAKFAIMKLLLDKILYKSDDD